MGQNLFDQYQPQSLAGYNQGFSIPDNPVGSWNPVTGQYDQNPLGSQSVLGLDQDLMSRPVGVQQPPTGMNNWAKFGLAANGAASILGGINAFQQNKLQREQFNVNKALVNRNIESSALVTNAALKRKAGMGAQLMGGYDPNSAGFSLARDNRYNPVSEKPVA